MLIFLAGITFGGLAVAAAYFIYRHLHRRLMADSLAMRLFLIRIPKETPEKGTEKDFKSEINRTEQLLAALAALRKSFVLEAAVPHIGEEIHFYLAVPGTMSEIAAKQIQGLWSGASVEPAQDDYNIFNVHGANAAGYIRQKENYILPVRTYQEIGADTFASILGGLGKIAELGEGAALQIVVQPAESGAKKLVQSAIQKLKKGADVKDVLGGNFASGFLETWKEAFRTEKKEKEERIVDEEAIKTLSAKISKPLFAVNVRLLSSAASQFGAEDILNALAAGFEQFGSPMRNQFRVVKPRNPAKLEYQFSFRTFEQSQAMILNSEEIASFYHLPISTTETPRVKWLKAKEAPPPADLPTKGTIIGESVFRGQARPVYITDDDRRRHIYVVGQTGVGKTTLLANMVAEDLKRGKGFALIEPHGDVAEKILGFIPPERLDDVIYFNPGDRERPLGLNMLEYDFDRPEQKTFIVNEMLNIFDKLYDLKTTGGPMFEQYMRNALLLLMEDMPNEPATLMEVPRIFTDADYRRRKLARITNPIVIDFWEKEASKVGGEASLQNMTPYITSKFNNFIANDYMRPIIGQPKSAFNFRKIMDEGKILIVSLSKGRIGDINAGLLGMIFTGKILMSALSRTDMPEEKRRDFYLYIDEFQNFATDAIATTLSEARKYRLALTMAHQYIAQLPEKIRDAVFGNVGSQIVMRVGAQDAEFLVKQFEPTFNENDLIGIDNFNAYVKLLINGQTSKPFNMRTLPPERPNTELISKVLEYSRRKYGADLQEVEREVYRRLRE